MSEYGNGNSNNIVVMKGGSIGRTRRSSSIPILDSLPYIDTIHPEYEHYAISLLEQEMQQVSSTSAELHPRVQQLIQSAQHPTNPSRKRTRLVTGEEKEDVVVPNQKENSGTTGIKLTDVTKEVFPSPPSSDHPTKIDEWQTTVRKARIAYEKERVRSMELNIDQEMLSESWKRFNQDILQPQLEQYQTLVQDEQYQVSKINLERQERQTKEYHATLSQLQYQYHDLVQKISALRHAIDTTR